MDRYRPGDKIRPLVARRDRLVTLDVTLGAESGRPWRLQPKPDATTEQQRRLTGWLGQKRRTAFPPKFREPSQESARRPPKMWPTGAAWMKVNIP